MMVNIVSNKIPFPCKYELSTQISFNKLVMEVVTKIEPLFIKKKFIDKKAELK